MFLPSRSPWGWVWWNAVLPLHHRWNSRREQQRRYEPVKRNQSYYTGFMFQLLTTWVHPSGVSSSASCLRPVVMASREQSQLRAAGVQPWMWNNQQKKLRSNSKNKPEMRAGMFPHKTQEKGVKGQPPENEIEKYFHLHSERTATHQETGRVENSFKCINTERVVFFCRQEI